MSEIFTKDDIEVAVSNNTKTTGETIGSQRGHHVSVLPGGTYTLAYDTTTTANTIYLGSAVIGSATSAAVWQINKIDTSTGLQTWSDSNSDFDNIWDNRASLTYG